MPRIATHLTRTHDGKSFFIDAHIGMQYVFGTLPVDGGDFVLWHRFERNYNHAQISPTDPGLVLFAQEYHDDPITGLTFPITNRMWTMRPGEEPQPVLKEPALGDARMVGPGRAACLVRVGQRDLEGQCVHP